ncbi:carboxypeptidase regulatory-like domain-containing protein [Schlesneria paludicola]|uniref:carboxypeptidase regulatory-like domain-containing protein n=1 Tax=Schlesneria paludicola TaxID=360056 RepID=UPI00029A27ED|nr:carboxypeptidase regulatory-like domain-containing protein [Schlesneria paludicola]
MSLSFEASVVLLAIKVSLTLLAAWLGHAIVSQKNPRWQVLIWRVAASAMAVCFVGTLVPPLYLVPFLRAEVTRERVPPQPEAARVAVELPTALASSTPSPTDQSGGHDTERQIPGNEAGLSLSSTQTDPIPASHGTSETRPIVTLDPSPSESVSIASGPADAPLGWMRIAFVVYAAVAGVLLLRLLIGLRAAKQECRMSTPAPDWIVAIAAPLTERSALSVRMTDRFESPVLCGLIRQTILLPTALLQSSSAEIDVRAAIAHETAHAVGHDLGWDCFLGIMAAVVWPVPLVWRMRSVHRAACERVSDRVAVDCVGDLVAYQRLIARIALRIAGEQRAVGMAMARRSDVRERLAALLMCPGVPVLGWRGILLASGVMIAAGVVGSGSLGPRAADANPLLAEKDNQPVAADEVGHERAPLRTRPEKLRFQVVRSDNNEPLSDAKITVQLYHPQQRDRRDLLTDEMGQVDFEYPDGDVPIQLWGLVKRPGFVPYFANFGRNLIPTVLPTEKIIRMDVGKTVGGIVVDSSGAPIAGVALSILIPATDTPSEIHYTIFEETTNEDGKWRFDGAPLSHGLNVSLSHPRFTKGSQSVQDRVDGRYVLEPGLTLTGHVTDENGQPVPGARITIGRDRFGSDDKPSTVEKDGSYAVYALRPQSTYVTVEAPGFAPQVVPIDLDANSKSVDFKLKPGHLIQFHVLDEAGNPIQAASIFADTWNGFRTLRWVGKSDAQGNVAWNGAPAENVKFDIVHEGYAYLRNLYLGPQEEPHQIQLLPPLVVSGTVVDTKQAKVAKFNVCFGAKYNGREEITWDTNDGSNGKNGKFEVRYLESCEEVFLRIEAEGFRPWISDAIPFRKANHKVFVKLEPGRGPMGIVWSPDGTPAEGAQLTLVTAKDGMQFTAGYRPSGGKQTVKSEAEGRFEFRPCDDESLIVAVHPTGYAEVTTSDFINKKAIHLHHWARLEVLVRQGRAPLAEAGIRIDPIRQTGRAVQVFSYGIQGKTNAEGRAVFDRVVPGEVWVSKSLEQVIGSGSVVYGERAEKVGLLPGARKLIELGGSGVMVKGQIRLPENPPEPHLWSLNAAARIYTQPTSTNPESRSYQMLIGKDGSFELHDVAPGRYQFQLDLTAVPDPAQCGTGAAMGRITREIDIPETDPVLDLGVIEGTWFKRLGAGEAAPVFVATGLNGDNIRSTDLRGRLTLIDFWATWCGPCMAEMPDLVELHEQFQSDPRFELVGVSVDRSMEEATTAINKHGWKWKFAYAGGGMHTLIPSRFDVTTIPVKFLIDVDGTILYRGQDLRAITKLIQKRLADLSNSTSLEAEDRKGRRSKPSTDSFSSPDLTEVAVVADNLEYPSGTAPRANGAGLTLWFAEKQPLRSFADVGTSRWLSGPHRAAVDSIRSRIAICDTWHKRLVVLDRFGRKHFETELPGLHAVSVDEQTGEFWCLALSILDSGELVVLDENGNERTRYPISAYGIEFSPADDAFWVVGKSLAKMTRDGKTVSVGQLSTGAYTFTDIAVDRTVKGAWVLEDDHPDLPASQLRLWRVQPDGTAQPTYRFPEKTLARSLALIGGRPWIATRLYDRSQVPTESEWSIQRFTTDGVPSELSELAASDVTKGAVSGAIWIRTKESLQRIERDGTVLKTISLPEKVKCMQILAF